MYPTVNMYPSPRIIFIRISSILIWRLGGVMCKKQCFFFGITVQQKLGTIEGTLESGLKVSPS